MKNKCSIISWFICFIGVIMTIIGAIQEHIGHDDYKLMLGIGLFLFIVGFIFTLTFLQINN